MWIIVFSSSLHITMNMQAELSTIYHGLMIALNFKDSRIKLESNSLEAMNIIKHGDTFTHEYGVIFEDIKHLFSYKPSVLSISHILREANKYVDLLTKMDSQGYSDMHL